MNRQIHLDGCAPARLAGKLQRTVMRLEYAENGRHTQAPSGKLGGVERLEDPSPGLIIHSAAVIGNLQAEIPACRYDCAKVVTL